MEKKTKVILGVGGAILGGVLIYRGFFKKDASGQTWYERMKQIAPEGKPAHTGADGYYSRQNAGNTDAVLAKAGIGTMKSADGLTHTKAIKTGIFGLNGKEWYSTKGKVGANVGNSSYGYWK